MYKRYYSDRDNREFNTEEECRDHELSIEAVEHLCAEPKPKEFFQPPYTEEAASDYLSDEVIEKLAKRYAMNPDFSERFFGNIEFSFFIENRNAFRKIVDLADDIQNYIETAKKIDQYIDDPR
ncbi:hypothetical protein [Vulcanococcus sp. Clear-D1]|uniref:hypothetical protein n=1 Tax=Vulcanococcus sp. Clear-D1 TaxID=2766970 RepID=UPI00198298A9|nr:hypothetical protein [Vulcanococcus sp. Clear-D1]MBD1194166.1 hypothetical protein [Vulcanococcus sp. Clear-D1]